MIVGTAGHIDHGKTSLVRALTGVEGDRLKEEKARGITIDLGFAYLPLPDGPTIGFIDVPGHEKFVRTMVAGSTGIDMALLVVAADDGVMPQTVEHLAILDLLGIRHGVVALTKMDLVSPERLAEVTAGIRTALNPTCLAHVDIIPVSVATGDGVDTLRERLSAEAWSRQVHHDDARFRLAIDRVFTLTGIGVVVTGTVLSGAVQLKDAVMISPQGLAARVRSIHAQNQEADEGCAGDRVALNLAGPDISKDAIHRGDMVLDPFLHAPTDRIDARLRLLPGEPRPITSWFPARLHHGSVETGVRIVLLEGDALRPGDAADVQLVLDHPIAAASLDRFVLRDTTAQRTIGGGFFMDLRAPARQRRTPARMAERAAWADPDARAALARLMEAPPHARRLSAFARDRALSSDTLDVIIRSLLPVILGAGDEQIALNATQWQRVIDTVVARLALFHTEHPDLQGMPRETLRRATEPRLAAPAFTQALLHADLRTHVARDGAFVRLASHVPVASAADEAAWQAIAPLLGGETRFRPPRVRDIAAMLGRPEADIRQRMKSAARRGLADEIAHDHFFLRDVVHEMVQIAVDVAAHAPDGRFTAAQFRDRLDNGRKVAIQILEFFDRQGVMLNRGTVRSIRADYTDLFAPTARL
ncbi:selenocysteine-specific translation elongation factor [Luteibacter aegosomatissinici]|uniref:selenocysteine-specific translation elongation factor n=1 Tax=Luteibacter aegosomatissinici TaxID=2911539 RepID=UPI001FFB6F4D|nr:selenocysteine-specific translation elongation factor [Luteibacter aegosomatissinici]UPG92551.1 selenocysteine-specific translation elongation factor [Luteibacter aegosomatissinici]